MKILCIEDDPEIGQFLQSSLEQAGHSVDLTLDGQSGLLQAMAGEYQVMIVDRMLPDRDGAEVIRMLRAGDIATPILVLSALSDVDHRVDGLQAGADDYLVKPFVFSELLARVEALNRRTQLDAGQQTVTQLSVADLVMDLPSQQVTRQGQPLELLAREYNLLRYLMDHAGQIVTRTMLLEQVWDLHFDPQTNIIDVYISRLRQKVDKPFSQQLIHTVRGQGYCIREPA